ncbi:MAG: class A beta-lactamase-related serine hydrolase [Bacteroidota bacterium]|nr:class A beta-lactamase-related serine hydrolase [Bacteroidota bacterium]
MRFYFFCLPFLFSLPLLAQPKTNDFLAKILLQNKDSLFQKVLTHPDEYRLQIIYTQINRDKNNQPHFTHYSFHLDPQLYFYPASTVKLPLAALSLEKIDELHQKGINKFTSMQFDSAYPRQTKEWYDSTSQTGLPSIAQFIRKAFLISDNDAYNRMYQFVGQKTINEKLHQKGYFNTRIVRQFMGFTDDENRHTNPIRFFDAKTNLLYQQPLAYNTDSFRFPAHVYVGKGYLDKNDSLINEPMDFAKHNTIPLYDLQQMLQSILFPLSVPPKQRFHLTKQDYDFLQQYLSQYPSETPYPKYDTTEYYDSYVKFFFNDSNHHAMPRNIRVFNKVGWAYGFLSDVSYVVDFANNVEFMLAATIYVNKDSILNDEKYEYESVGQPFLYQLGQNIYNYELHRKRTVVPNLSNFKIQYEHRDPNDARPAIKNADN